MPFYTLPEIWDTSPILAVFTIAVSILSIIHAIEVCDLKGVKNEWIYRTSYMIVLVRGVIALISIFIDIVPK